MKTLLKVLCVFVLPFCLQSQTGACLHFDGVDDQISLTHFSRPSVMTIEAWIKTTSITDAQIVGWAGNTNNSAEFKISGGQVYYFEWDNTNWVGVGSLVAVNDGQWHHVAVTRSAATVSNVSIYVDGQLKNVGTVDLTLTTNALNIGAYNYSGLSQFYNGSLDEVRIWDRVLCDLEIQSHKNCELVGNEVGLLRYYQFNQGVGSALNPTVKTLSDSSPNLSNGVLNYFALAGSSSNWLSPAAVPSGSVCSDFLINYVINSPTVCLGSAAVLSVSGASNGFTWMPSGQTGFSVVVSPSITTVYTLAVNLGATGCTSFKTSTIIPVGTTVQVTGPAKVCAGEMITLTATGANTFTWNMGATGASLSLVVNSSTHYTVTGTNSGCFASKSFSVETDPCVGINSLPAIVAPKAYPNPTSGILFIDGQHGTEIEVFSLSGSIFRKVAVDQKTGEVDLSLLPDGLYLIRFNDGRFTKIAKAEAFN